MDIILEWHSPEHHFDKKSNDWYWILGIIAFAISVLAFYFGNFLFAIFVLIAGFTIGIMSYKETKVVPIKVVYKGVIFDRQLYPWLSLRSFWIEDDHVHGARILLHPLSNFLPMIVIPINDEVDLNDVRDVLLEFLEEEYLQESILHKWFDKLIAR